MSTFNKYRLKGAYHFDWYETEDWYRWCVDRCAKFCKGTTIDVGCGDGLLLSKLPSGSLGLDSDIDALRLCSERGLDTVKVDLDNPTTTDSPPGEYDYVASINTIEHLNDTTHLMSLVKGARKGAVIITIDWQGGPFGEDHKHEYTLPELTALFSDYKVKPFRYKETEWIGVEVTK